MTMNNNDNSPSKQTGQSPLPEPASEGSAPADYETLDQPLQLAGHELLIRTLKDRNQYHDPDGEHEAQGVAPSSWPLFGVIWPAGLLLAEMIATMTLNDKRVLELGCGLGLASMIAAQRGARVIASDVHPLAETFLAHNTQVNGLDDVEFLQLDWHVPADNLGQFDLLMASDVLYEPDHPELLAAIMTRHAAATTEVIVTDQGRKQLHRFVRLMEKEGFTPLQEITQTNKLAHLYRGTS